VVKDGGSLTGLDLLAQVLENYVADERGDEGDYEVGGGEDVVKSEGHAFAAGVGGGKLAHQQVGIEQEDDECDLDYGPENRDTEWTIWGAGLHGIFMVSRTEWSRSWGAAGLSRIDA